MSSNITFFGTFVVDGISSDMDKKKAISVASKKTNIPKNRLHASKSKEHLWTFRIVDDSGEFDKIYEKTRISLGKMLDEDIIRTLLPHIGLSRESSQYDIKVVMDMVKSGSDEVLSLLSGESISKIDKTL